MPEGDHCRLASNALIGLVGNTSTRLLPLVRISLASNALIGLVGNTFSSLSNHKAWRRARFQCVNWISWKLGRAKECPWHMATTRFQCVNWISWKPVIRRRPAIIGSLASNALIGLVGNLTGPSGEFAITPLASNALIGLVGNQK